jgi:hypothetical protein
MARNERNGLPARNDLRPTYAGCARGVCRMMAGAVLAAGALAAPAVADDFRAFTWGKSSPAETPNLSPMVWITRDANLDDVARQLKALPAGNRFALLFLYVNDLADNPADRCVKQVVTLTTQMVPAPASAGSKAAATTAPAKISAGRTAAAPAAPAMVPVTVRTVANVLTEFRGPWMDNGTAAVRSRMTALVAGLKARGATVDGFVFDNETTLHATNFMGRDGAFAAVQADPRWPALAAQLGLPQDISSPANMYWGSPAYYKWTDVMSARFDAAMNAAVYAPIKAAFPNAVVSNYMSAKVTAPYATPDITGKMDTYSTAGFGTHDTGEFYGMLTGQRMAAISSASAFSAGGGDAWLAFRLEVHKVRGIMASSSRPKQAWIANRSWGDLWSEPGFTVGLASNPYWDEMVLQLGMNGVSTFLNWNADAWIPGQDLSNYNPRADRIALDALLAELDTRVGAATGSPVAPKQPSWSDRVVATGRQVGTDMVWRFSFDQGVDSVVVSFTDGSTATVAPEAGRRGAWLTYPASKTIVMDRAGAMPSMLMSQAQAVVAR